MHSRFGKINATLRGDTQAHIYKFQELAQFYFPSLNAKEERRLAAVCFTSVGGRFSGFAVVVGAGLSPFISALLTCFSGRGLVAGCKA